MAAPAARRWRWRRWRWRTRDAVAALLLASVLAPLALYSGAPISPFSGPIRPGRSSLARDPSNSVTRNKMRERLNALAQDKFGSVKESVQKFASSTGARKDRGAEMRHDGRNVLRESNESTGSKDGRPKNGEEIQEKVLQNPVTIMREHVDDTVIKGKESSFSSDRGTDHEVSAMRGDPKFPLRKENTAYRSSKQFTGATSEGSDARAISNNTSHHTASPDSKISAIKDQLRRAKTYIGLLPSRGNNWFARDLRRKLRDIQQTLGDATSSRRLPKNVHGKIRSLELTLTKIKQLHENCAAIIDKLIATLHSTEDKFQSYKQQAHYVAQIAAKALPKRLHCLAMRLTNEYYLSSSYNKYFLYEEKFEDPKLQHYALFSDNVLAAAVVVNSTLVNAKKPGNHVFHIVTDKINYAAMRMWFLGNTFGKAAVQVQKIEEFTWLNSSYSPVLKQLESYFMINYYFRIDHDRSDKNTKFRNPKYLSILNHLRFYLPEIFPKLNKVLFLDDDIVVQQDLSSLWSIDLKGNVNAAVQTCGETFHRFDRYLNFSNPLIAKKFDRRACGWAYGMNMFDLSEWRKQNITDVYHYWQKQNANRQLWKLGTLPAGLVTFWNRTFPIDRSWHLLGLGYKPNVNERDIERAAVIHYNGNLKPWLEIGLSRYRKYWSKYVNFDHVFLRECNVNP
ncbi:hypothetical protein ACP4OV_017894 [Aristida adscensionis]